MENLLKSGISRRAICFTTCRLKNDSLSTPCILAKCAGIGKLYARLRLSPHIRPSVLFHVVYYKLEDVRRRTLLETDKETGNGTICDQQTSPLFYSFLSSWQRFC